jgi:hypothetical protein
MKCPNCLGNLEPVDCKGRWFDKKMYKDTPFKYWACRLIPPSVPERLSLFLSSLAVPIAFVG